jgi:hypothetical protein
VGRRSDPEEIAAGKSMNMPTTSMIARMARTISQGVLRVSAAQVAKVCGICACGRIDRSGCDAALGLELSEHVLDPVALATERETRGIDLFAVCL